MDVARKASQEEISFADEASPPEAQPLKAQNYQTKKWGRRGAISS